MNMKYILASFALIMAFSVNAQDSTLNNSANSSSSTQSNSTASNGGLQNQQNFITNNPGTVQYSGRFTQRNVPSMALGAFGTSFSSDYCNGTMQASVGFAGFGAAAGKQKLDKGCQLLRTADMTMRIAGVYSAKAAQEWEFSKQFNGSKDGQMYAQQVRDASYAHAEKADELMDGAVNMLCTISDETRKALVDSGIECPKH